MGEAKKITVGVLFGGKSAEHEVSCISAYSVLKNMDREKFDIKMVGITKDGDFLPFEGPIEDIKEHRWTKTEYIKGITEGVKVLESCDVIFPVLHGTNGEDGTVQGLLELLDKPYVGCNVLSSALAMDKAYAKIVFKAHGLPMCKHIVLTRTGILNNMEACIEEAANKIGYPCFVKPANSGSSVGVYKCQTKEELENALYEAQKLDRRILVEEAVKGREIECAVLGNENDVRVAIPGEIIPSKEFYDYEDKYLSGKSVISIPANLPEDKRNEVMELAMKAYKSLDCSGLSRVDFFYVDETGEFYLNEINTLPGFTDISMYSKMWEASGLTYTQLLTELIELAVRRKQETKREF
ncbi:MAG: D-alanine--D-alanine ligase [Clostridiaceae bacterium]|jgi:D-alanine-D-alanine ligase|nr:D-alanine--D-alanine ligase [Clostridiaceae bacterium]